MINKRATIQIPNKVKDVVLLNCLILLDKIRNPKTNKIKNGKPTRMIMDIASNQCGNIESSMKGGSCVNSSPKPNSSKLPTENNPKINPISVLAETITMMIPINFPITLKNVVKMLPNVSRNS